MRWASVFIILLVAQVLAEHIPKWSLEQQNPEESQEQKVFNYLFNESRGYNHKIPPPTVDHITGKTLHTDIDIQLELMGIMEVDKDASTVTFKSAFRQWWYDPRLSWNKDDFGGIDRIWLSSSDKDCWLPDTIIREDAGGSYFSDFKENEVRIHADGLHYWSRLGDLKVVASLDFTKYPFDIQRINITVGSWLYFDARLSYNLRQTDGKDDGLIIQNPKNWFTENIEWDFGTSATEKIQLVQP